MATSTATGDKEETLEREREGGWGRTNGGDGGDDLAELELVQDGGFTGGVETDHEDAHLALGEELLEQLRESQPHGGGTPRDCNGAARDRASKRGRSSRGEQRNPGFSLQQKQGLCKQGDNK